MTRSSTRFEILTNDYTHLIDYLSTMGIHPAPSLHNYHVINFFDIKTNYMAEINVEPKKPRKSPVWPWILGLLGIVVVVFLLTRERDDDDNMGTADSYTTISDDAAKRVTWNSINWNAPAITYDEINDREINVRGEEGYSIYSLDEATLFDAGKASLRPEAGASLRQIVESINQRYRDGDVRIYHFSMENNADNNELSKNRADAIKDWLKDNNIDVDDLSIRNKDGDEEKIEIVAMHD